MPVDIVTTLYGRQERSWQLQANCMGVDPDLFFPERGASTREAKEVCRGCVVREDCLEYALANGEKFGIWGGMSERERRRLRRARALARRVAPLVRGPAVRALGLAVGTRAQVSCNLVDPDAYGPARLYDAVAVLVREAGGQVEGGELVGLIPESVLAPVPPDRRGELGLSEEATVEARLPASW